MAKLVYLPPIKGTLCRKCKLRKKVLTSRTILCEVRGDTKKRDDHCEFFDNKNVQVKVIKMGFLDAIEGGFA